MQLLVFVKFYCIGAMSVVSEIGWNRPCSLEYIISKNEKSVVFFLTALGRGWDLVFAGSFCRLLLYESAIAFSCFVKNKFQESLYNYY